MALSEHLLDKNLEAASAESSTEETPFNCQGHSHLYNSLEHRDYHKRDKDKFYPCDQTICSNWFSGPYHRGTHWGGIPVEHWQETGTVYSEFASTSFFKGSEPELQHLASIPEYGSPSIPSSRVFSPTPEVSPLNQSPSFVPTTLPSDLSNLLEEVLNFYYFICYLIRLS